MKIIKLARTLASLAILAVCSSPAFAYDVRDAGYVTKSKNIDVLFYIVCLQEKNEVQPRSLSAPAALNKAVEACRKEAAKLPKGAGMPTVPEIKLSILECGFRPKAANADVNCGNAKAASTPRKTTTKKKTTTAKAPSRPARGSTTRASKPKTTQATTARKVTNRTATRLPKRPVRVANTTPRPPKASSTVRSGFPMVAGSRGSNIRTAPQANATKLGSTASGQPVTLLAKTNVIYQGYPWFKVRMNNGKEGYQWGGGICAKPRTKVAGTKGTCSARATTRAKIAAQRPSGSASVAATSRSKAADTTASAQNSNAADVIIGVLGLIGKVIDSENADKKTNTTTAKANTATNQNNANTDAAVFTQTLSVVADGPFVTVSREVSFDKTAALYTVRGKKGEVLDVEVWSPNSNVVFEIFVGRASNGGTTLPGAGEGDNAQTFWRELPRDGEYQILVGTLKGTEEFELSVGLDSAQPGQTTQTTANAGAVFSGGTLALNRRVVGTYSSRTATSGNLELNEAANALTWTEFCGPIVVLGVDWTNNLLLPNSGIGALELDMTSAGKVRGFNYNGHKYKKDGAIVMPGCVGANDVTANAAAIQYWIDNPQDPRTARIYDKVANAWWGICEAENNDPNAITFNNEATFWDCADRGQIDGGGTLTALGVAAPTIAPDQRASQDYSAVPHFEAEKCASAYPNSPQDDKNFYDCMDLAYYTVLEEQEDDAGAGTDPNDELPDPRHVNGYELVTGDQWQYCWTLEVNGQKPVYDCLDGYQAAASAANNNQNAVGQVTDSRETKPYEAVTPDEWNACWAQEANGKSVVFDCLDAYEAANIGAGTIDNGAAQSDPQYDEQAIQARIETEFWDMDQAAIEECAVLGYGSEDFFYCLGEVRVSLQEQSDQQSQDGNDGDAEFIEYSLGEIDNICEGNGDCVAELQSCFYEFGSIDSEGFGYCSASWQ